MGSPTSLPRLQVFTVPNIFFMATQNGKTLRKCPRTLIKGNPAALPALPSSPSSSSVLSQMPFLFAFSLALAEE